ncbi:MAG: beta-ketoacyl-ACP synthase II [Eubacteriales bacterium]|nr:beta-ketoacyl-ACP synthase II [Eubacteriales bacterium]MDD3882112.1 beta-ketoacyl-ACP synthase II [Eubacteriales bacterium]MDD4513217.1 beta-ketoacyl-ACP synthase II [Eubacteriales bacterium]
MARVVITGMGVISPLGNSVDALWDALKAGKCGIDVISKFDASQNKVKVAAEVKEFTPSDYGIDKSAARRLDLYSQYAMAAAKQAFEQSGLVSGENIEAERLGVYVGSGIGGLITFAQQTEVFLSRGIERISPFFAPMMLSNMATGNISIAYKAEGATLPVVTACATSANAIGEAFHAIKHGYADAVCAGGSEAPIHPIAIGAFSALHALSCQENPALASLPFDKRRGGFVLGEGAAIVMLEEYEHAKARNANIICEVVGYGNTADAYHVTAPDPEAKGAARAVSQALSEGGYNGTEALYINAHGTGTQLNDTAETKAVKLALKEKAYDASISSTKSMTGHMMGAAGAIECLISALAIRDGLIPPTIGLNEPDDECDLDYTPLTAKERAIDAALSISLGFGGHNACLMLRRV